MLPALMCDSLPTGSSGHQLVEVFWISILEQPPLEKCIGIAQGWPDCGQPFALFHPLDLNFKHDQWRSEMFQMLNRPMGAGSMPARTRSR